MENTEKTFTYTCPHGGHEIIADSQAALGDKIAIHDSFWHTHGGRCRATRQPVTPIRPAYLNGGANGVTGKGSPA